MIIASIDIGTNTVLLLIAEVEPNGAINTLAYEQRIPRLGKGVDASKNLHPDSMQRVLDVLLEYKSIINRFNVERTVVCGTSAVRDAHNREEFRQEVQSRAGFELEVLNGSDEAFWTFRGTISGIAGITKATVIDIGGGSTEIAIGSAREIVHSTSLDVGSVRLAERFFKHDPPTHPELESAITLVEDQLAQAARFDFTNSLLVGVAGTATSLALFAQGRQDFSIAAVANYRLDIETVYQLFRTLRSTPSHEILVQSPIMKGREDVIAAGALILREIMAHCKFTTMIVSERGLRYGLALREWERNTQHQ